MGGAIALHSANQIPSLLAVVVIDVVEGMHQLELSSVICKTGTAMESLPSMQAFLSSRPKCFRSLEHAIEWWYVSLCVCVCVRV